MAKKPKIPKKPSKRRNSHAAALRSALFQPKVKPSPKTYNRKWRERPDHSAEEDDGTA